jgi:hypothetical protein
VLRGGGGEGEVREEIETCTEAAAGIRMLLHIGSCIHENISILHTHGSGGVDDHNFYVYCQYCSIDPEIHSMSENIYPQGCKHEFLRE